MQACFQKTLCDWDFRFMWWHIFQVFNISIFIVDNYCNYDNECYLVVSNCCQYLELYLRSKTFGNLVNKNIWEPAKKRPSGGRWYTPKCVTPGVSVWGQRFHDIWHFMIFDIPWHLTFHDIWHLTFHDIKRFMTFNILWHLTIHYIWHFITFYISWHFTFHDTKYFTTYHDFWHFMTLDI